METILTPASLEAMVTAIAGVALFGLAETLPSVFPPAFARFVGLVVVLAMIAPLYAVTGSWTPVVIVIGSCLAAIIVIHLWQFVCGMKEESSADESEPQATAKVATPPTTDTK